MAILQHSKKGASTREGTGRDVQEELRRLPLLLRLLSASRPLASLPVLPGHEPTVTDSGDLEQNGNNIDGSSDGDGRSSNSQQLSSEADRTVPLLEQVAAYHPQSELIEQIASTYVPAATRVVGRVASVTRKRRRWSAFAGAGDGNGTASTAYGENMAVWTREWDTSQLRAALSGKIRGTRGNKKKRRRRLSNLSTTDDDDGDDQDGVTGGGGAAAAGGDRDEIVTSTTMMRM